MEVIAENIPVGHELDIPIARSAARRMASVLGFDEIGGEEIEIAISEIATNLVKHHAVNGRIILTTIDGNDLQGPGIEIKSEDHGPGIKDIENALHEGVSTAGTLGAGLSGVRRLMDEFQIESMVGMGTRVTARKWVSPYPKRMAVSVFSRPKPGENKSGDAYFIKRFSHYAVFSVIDALGHGDEAHKVSQLALGVLDDNYSRPVIDILKLCHLKMINTRGASMSLCRFDFKNKKFEHICIGNVETRIYGSPAPIRPFCFNGTVGMAIESHRVIEYPYAEGITMIMFSDGISGKFDLETQTLNKAPQNIAEFLFNNFSKSSDDATVLVAR